MQRKGLRRRNTDMEFNEFGHCLICKNDSRNNLLIPLKTLKLRLFLYVQKAIESKQLNSDDPLDNKSICQFHLQQILDNRIDDLLEEDLDQLYKLQEEGIKVLGQYEVEEDHWLQVSLFFLYSAFRKRRHNRTKSCRCSCTCRRKLDILNNSYIGSCLLDDFKWTYFNIAQFNSF